MSLSLVNSTNVPLLEGDSFIGSSYDNILDFVQITISIKCDTGYNLTYIYSQNKVDIDYQTTQTITAQADTQFYNVVVKDRYFKLRIDANDGDMSVLNVQTIYKTSTTYEVSSGTGSNVNIIGPVDVITKYVQVTVPNGVVVSGSVTTDISGQTVDISGQTVDISGQTVDISGQTVDISGQSVVVSGTVSTDISGQTVDISGQSVVVSGTVSTDISGQTVDISGQSVVVSGTVSTDISGQTVDISGQSVVVSGTVSTDISGQTVDISGQSVVVSGTVSTDISGQTVDISGQSVVVSGTVSTDISGQTVDISGQSVVVSGTVSTDISGQTVDISGQTVIVSSTDISTIASSLNNQRITSTVWNNVSVVQNGQSDVISPGTSTYCNTTLSCYGTSSQNATIAVQFSNNGTTFYTTQYQYTLTAGNFGFSIPCSAYHIRLILLSAVTSTITAYIDIC